MHQHHSADRACRLDPVSRTAAHYRDLGSPPSLVIAGLHLTEAEALLLTARGLLVPHVNSVYGSTPPCPESRATAAALHLRPLSRQRAILHRLTAAWIYGCAPPPALLECTAFGPSGLTLDPVESAFVRHRYTTYTTYEALRIGPLRVTTPLRTCVDLAAFGQDKHGDTALATLLRAPGLGCAPETVCAALEAVPRLAFRKRAVRRVHALSEGLPWGHWDLRLTPGPGPTGSVGTR
ncbi:hypothetical protein AB0Y14_01215 [Rothia sp. HC945]|uniref:hypothetical protein n=1 Tax=Rothia sp. HC945 TaxID=3171170 RepID=UPI003F26F9FF